MEQICEYRVSLAEEEEGEKLIFDRIWFSRKTAILEGAAM